MDKTGPSSKLSKLRKRLWARVSCKLVANPESIQTFQRLFIQILQSVADKGNRWAVRLSETASMCADRTASPKLATNKSPKSGSNFIWAIVHSSSPRINRQSRGSLCQGSKLPSSSQISPPIRGNARVSPSTMRTTGNHGYRGQGPLLPVRGIEAEFQGPRWPCNGAGTVQSDSVAWNQHLKSP